MRCLMTCVLVLSISAPSAAEDALTSPYRDQTAAEIRGLTEKEISELREGRGMGLARAAELNGYPGPRHVLDAAREGRLHLSPGQLQAVQRLFDHIRHGYLKPSDIVTHRIPLEHIAEGYHIFSAKLDDCIKPLIVPSGT